MWRDVVRAPCSLEDGLLPNSILHETLHQGLAKLTEEELRCLSGAMSLWGTSLIDRLNISPPNLPLGYLMSQDEQLPRYAFPPPSVISAMSDYRARRHLWEKEQDKQEAEEMLKAQTSLTTKSEVKKYVPVDVDIDELLDGSDMESKK